MKRKLFSMFVAVLAVAFGALSASAQSPVKWSASAQMTSATEGVVTLTAQIDEGWHVYGLQMPEDGPSATKISFVVKGVTFNSNLKVWPAPSKEMDPMFGAELTYWDHKVTFTRSFTISSPESASLAVKVHYMCCNDSNCRPPVTETIEVNLPK